MSRDTAILIVGSFAIRHPYIVPSLPLVQPRSFTECSSATCLSASQITRI